MVALFDHPRTYLQWSMKSLKPISNTLSSSGVGVIAQLQFGTAIKAEVETLDEYGNGMICDDIAESCMPGFIEPIDSYWLRPLPDTFAALFTASTAFLTEMKAIILVMCTIDQPRIAKRELNA